MDFVLARSAAAARSAEAPGPSSLHLSGAELPTIRGTAGRIPRPGERGRDVGTSAVLTTLDGRSYQRAVFAGPETTTARPGRLRHVHQLPALGRGRRMTSQ
jgi:hypothetical protein